MTRDLRVGMAKRTPADRHSSHSPCVDGPTIATLCPDTQPVVFSAAETSHAGRLGAQSAVSGSRRASLPVAPDTQQASPSASPRHLEMQHDVSKNRRSSLQSAVNEIHRAPQPVAHTLAPLASPCLSASPRHLQVQATDFRRASVQVSTAPVAHSNGSWDSQEQPSIGGIRRAPLPIAPAVSRATPSSIPRHFDMQRGVSRRRRASLSVAPAAPMAAWSSSTRESHAQPAIGRILREPVPAAPSAPFAGASTATTSRQAQVHSAVSRSRRVSLPAAPTAPVVAWEARQLPAQSAAGENRRSALPGDPAAPLGILRQLDESLRAFSR